jgi:exopolysaccharide biosynthesis WecB/TagA/CpsF family protein
MTNRFLIVQLADIGDLILSTPALSALSEAHPNAHITLLTTAHAAPVIEGTRLVDEVITFERQQFNSPAAFFQPANLRRIWALRQGRYDTVIFFHHFTFKLGTLKFGLIALASRAKRIIGLDNGNGWFLTESLPDEGFGAKHQAQYWLDLAGLVGASSLSRPSVVSCQSVEYSALGIQNSELKTVVVHAGSGGYSLARRWDATQFARVADALQQHYRVRIILVGGVNDDGAAVKAAMQTEPVDLTGKTSLDGLAGVIQAADLFIGADSGVMHLAAAVRTPIIAIFGPSNPDAWGPWTPAGEAIVIRSAPECSPCSYMGHGVGLREGCKARTCMRMVTSEQVLDAAQKILNRNPTERLRTDAEVTRNSATQSSSPRIRILGLPVDVITYSEWLDWIEVWVKSDNFHHVCTINPEFIMIARRDPNFYNILNRADLCIADGVGLLWAARYLGTPLPERVTGSDGVPMIAERAAQKGWKLFLLGAAQGVADKAAGVLSQKYVGLQIVGTFSGSPDPEEEDSIVERVNASGADLLFVAYGAPEQDKWIARNSPRLKVKMAMGVGGALDFIADVVPRAPLWMQRMGLEWLFRLYLQPWRIVRMMRLPHFVLTVFLRGRNA